MNPDLRLPLKKTMGHVRAASRVDRDVESEALLVDAYPSHASVVTAFTVAIVAKHKPPADPMDGVRVLTDSSAFG